MREKIVKLLSDPLGVLKRRFSSFLEPYIYWTPSGYRTQKYWSVRLSKYGLGLQGVGIEGLSQKENDLPPKKWT